MDSQVIMGLLIIGVVLLTVLWILSAIIYNIVKVIIYVTASPEKKVIIDAKNTKRRREAQAKWEADVPKREAMEAKLAERTAKREAKRVELNNYYKAKKTRKRRGLLGYALASVLLSTLKPRKAYTRKGTMNRRGTYASDAWMRRRFY